MLLDVAAIERATLQAVPPQRLITLDGWLVGLDDGTVGRVHSAVPTRHAPDVGDALQSVLSSFRDAGRQPVLRIPRTAAFDAIRARVGEAGLQARKPTLTMAGPVAGLMGLPETAPVEITDGPDGDWAGVFLGPGFDPVDGASRLAILRRGRANVFAGVRVAGDLVAVGSACFAEGWCGVHGMRTVPAARGRGWAGAILASFGRQAHQRGVESVFLQVEQVNVSAQALYRRAGLQDAFLYDYWSR